MKRITAIVKAKKIMSLEPVFLDTETTGFRSNAEICDISIVNFDGSILFDSLVKPINEIPEETTKIHGITNDMVANAPSFVEIQDEIAAILHARKVAIYNQSFDNRLLKQSAEHAGTTWQPINDYECVMQLYKDFIGSKKGYKLTDAAEFFKLSTDGAHRAKADCLMTLNVLKGISNHG